MLKCAGSLGDRDSNVGHGGGGHVRVIPGTRSKTRSSETTSDSAAARALAAWIASRGRIGRVRYRAAARRVTSKSTEIQRTFGSRRISSAFSIESSGPRRRRTTYTTSSHVNVDVVTLRLPRTTDSRNVRQAVAWGARPPV